MLFRSVFFLVLRSFPGASWGEAELHLFSQNCNDDKILISELNMKINEYLIEKNLIKDKKVYLNKELKKLLKTNKRIIELDEILNVIIKLNN